MQTVVISLTQQLRGLFWTPGWSKRSQMIVSPHQNALSFNDVQHARFKVNRSNSPASPETKPTYGKKVNPFCAYNYSYSTTSVVKHTWYQVVNVHLEHQQHINSTAVEVRRASATMHSIIVSHRWTPGGHHQLQRWRGWPKQPPTSSGGDSSRCPSSIYPRCAERKGRQYTPEVKTVLVGYATAHF